MTAVFGGWVVDEASRVVELVCDVDAVGVDAVFDEFVIVREEEKRFAMKTAQLVSMGLLMICWRVRIPSLKY